MFSQAVIKAAGFVRPSITSTKRFDGTLDTGIAAFVVVNEDGWIVTAYHIIEMLQNLHDAQIECKAFEARKAAIKADDSLVPKQRNRRLKKLQYNPKWPVDYSVWWGQDGQTLVDISALPAADLAVGRLEPFDAAAVSNYPLFKDPTKDMLPGTSLCRLGYPFHSITPTYEERGFVLPEGSVPPPLFPIEGIFTRHGLITEDTSSGYDIAFIETSSPGLRGQSGGPIFDTQATVWGIQSRTRHLELGFTPSPQGTKTQQYEHQFLNVGLGAHPETMIGFFRDSGISFELSDY